MGAGFHQGRIISGAPFSGEPEATAVASGSPLNAIVASFPQLLHPPPDFRLVAAVGRLVVAPLFRQVRLIDPAAFVVVAVPVAFAVAELLRPAVVGVAQVQRYRQPMAA